MIIRASEVAKCACCAGRTYLTLIACYLHDCHLTLFEFGLFGELISGLTVNRLYDSMVSTRGGSADAEATQ
jgi:hypothetical protein